MPHRASEYRIPFFFENDFVRKKCKICNCFFWTQDQDSTNCGDSPCMEYTFIKNSPVPRSYDVDEMRDLFLSFFEGKDHEVIDPYPVVARWRDDVYLVGASIYDFQPYVTEGIIKPPANPLVISQPCLRFTDVDNVGPTAGRHLVIFEMGGAHAFNYPKKEIYWKDNTVRLHHELLTEKMKVKSELISYKEDFWEGGGNAGPDVEACIGGLEISTLVFMSYKTVDGKLVEMPIKTVDTGYGIERWSWLSQGSSSGFHAVYPPVLNRILDLAGLKVDEDIIIESTIVSGAAVPKSEEDRLENRKKVAERLDMDYDELDRILTRLECAYGASDHTKALSFLLSEGVVPSNVREGYLVRLLFRRTYRMLEILGIEECLTEIIDAQISHWSKRFKTLKRMRDEIIEALEVENAKYNRTLKRGAELVKRMSSEIKSKGRNEIPLDALIQFYDSHGLVPEMVKKAAEDFGVDVKIPNNFFSMVAERQLEHQKEEEQKKFSDLEQKVVSLPETRTLYYEEPYKKQFTGKVLSVIEDKYMVLDQTCFYAEGGGQPADFGKIEFGDKSTKIVNVQKIGNVILHEFSGPKPKSGEVVKGSVDWDRRINLMRHHTSTHVLIGAIRRVLGEHAWQAGAEKGVERSRLDISHYASLNDDEIKKIEKLAFETIQNDIPVETSWLPREEAERLYGYRIYQGGAVPGREIRIVKVGDWDVEACGGMHLKSTGEVGVLKILKTERIQDGVERIIFASSMQVVNYMQERDKILSRISTLLEVPAEGVEKKIEALLEDDKKLRKRYDKLMTKTIEHELNDLLSKSVEIDGVKLLVVKRSGEDEKDLIMLGEEMIKSSPNSVVVFILVTKFVRVLVHAGKDAIKAGVHAGKLAAEIAKVVGGKGGGKDYFGQGGGKKISDTEKALSSAKESLSKQVKG
ncbi:MAG: alanine--tRNA ligase [Candidatus Bathyarchaeota archaeon]|nr:alanine--tRNA ligase [Candidatus Bathyarchaeota archaeon]